MSIFTPYLTGIKLGAVVLVTAVAVGGSYYAGYSHEKVELNLYKQTQAAEAQKQAVASQAAARDAETKAAAAQAQAIAAAVAQEKQNEASKDASIAALRNGTLQLSSELASTRKQLSVSKATGATDKLVQDSSGRLPEDTAEFLVSESARADALAIQYNKAVAQINLLEQECSSGTPYGKP